MSKEEEGEEIKRRERGVCHVCRLTGWGKFGFCNAPNPYRVRIVTIKIFRNKRTEFPLKLDYTQA